tara:strand:- start:10 stop:363 length:354 start_codon:yes stop_codon:yes gene_type:complete
MTTKQFTYGLKLKAVNYYHKINNYVKVCEVFECSERSLKRWVERYDYILNIPYNPQTNPIESYFSELKHYIKLDSKIEYIDFLKSIKKSIKKIKISFECLFEIGIHLILTNIFQNIC